MDAPDRRRLVLRKLAWACVLLVLAVTSLSAFIRLSRAGLGCAPWPQCHEQRAALPPEALAALDSPAVSAARMAHRVIASTALLVVIALAALALARRPMLWRAGRIALALAALALFLAVLGRLGGASRSPAVALGNLLAGFAMLALAWRLLQVLGPAPPVHPGLGPWALVALLALVLQVALGGWVSAGAAAGRCDAVASCQLHGLLGPATVALLLAVAVVAWRHDRPRAGAAVALLALVQGGVGIAQVAGPVPLGLGLAHNVVGALLLVTVTALLPAR